jgi:hypothetical protein
MKTARNPSRFRHLCGVAALCGTHNLLKLWRHDHTASSQADYHLSDHQAGRRGRRQRPSYPARAGVF